MAFEGEIALNIEFSARQAPEIGVGSTYVCERGRNNKTVVCVWTDRL